MVKCSPRLGNDRVPWESLATGAPFFFGGTYITNYTEMGIVSRFHAQSMPGSWRTPLREGRPWYDGGWRRLEWLRWGGPVKMRPGSSRLGGG